MSQEQVKGHFRIEATDGLWIRWYLGTFSGEVPSAPKRYRNKISG
jgi:hypothetical protein